MDASDVLLDKGFDYPLGYVIKGNFNPANTFNTKDFI